MENSKKSGNSVFAALAGVAVGAASLYLSDAKNRDALKKKFSTMKDTANEKVDEVKEKGKEKMTEIKQKGSDALEGVQDRLSEKADEADKEIYNAQLKIDINNNI